MAGLVSAPKNPTAELFNGATLREPKPTQQVQVVPELTLDEKIKTNYYKCDTERQYIRADNAECLDKPVVVQKASRGAVNASNGNLYDYHSCTWHAKSMRPDLPNNLGNAYSWVSRAQAQGIPTGYEARAGAVGQQGNHVVYIISVSGDRVYLSERNYDWNGSYRERWASASDFVYIY